MSQAFDVIAELSSRRKALTVMDVANMLGVSKQTVYDHVKRGNLPALQMGTTVRLNPRDVADWLQQRQTARSK